MHTHTHACTHAHTHTHTHKHTHNSPHTIHSLHTPCTTLSHNSPPHSTHSPHSHTLQKNCCFSSCKNNCCHGFMIWYYTHTSSCVSCDSQLWHDQIQNIWSTGTIEVSTRAWRYTDTIGSCYTHVANGHCWSLSCELRYSSTICSLCKVPALVVTTIVAVLHNYGMRQKKKNDVHLRGNHFHTSLLHTKLRKTQTLLWKIHKQSCTAFQKFMCVQTQCSSE